MSARSLDERFDEEWQLATAGAYRTCAAPVGVALSAAYPGQMVMMRALSASRPSVTRCGYCTRARAAGDIESCKGCGAPA